MPVCGQLRAIAPALWDLQWLSCPVSCACLMIVGMSCWHGGQESHEDAQFTEHVMQPFKLLQ